MKDVKGNNSLWDLLKLVLFIERLKSFSPWWILSWVWNVFQGKPRKQESQAVSGTHVFVKRFWQSIQKGHLLLTVGAKFHSFVSLRACREMCPHVPFGMIAEIWAIWERRRISHLKYVYFLGIHTQDVWRMNNAYMIIPDYYFNPQYCTNWESVGMLTASRITGNKDSASAIRNKLNSTGKEHWCPGKLQSTFMCRNQRPQDDVEIK